MVTQGKIGEDQPAGCGACNLIKHLTRKSSTYMLIVDVVMILSELRRSGCCLARLK